MANPYLQVLRTPHALPMVLAAFIGRLPLSMVGLGSVLLVASETGSYGLGGAVAAAGAVTTALAGPVIGRLADSLGQRRVLLPVLAVFVASGPGLPRRGQHRHWPLWTLFVAAGAGRRLHPAGLVDDPGALDASAARHATGCRRRWRWSRWSTSSSSSSARCWSPSCPPTGHATSGVVTAFTLATVGSLLFAAQHRTEPPPGGHESRNGPVGDADAGPAGAVRGRAPPSGAILGTLEIALVAFADQVGAQLAVRRAHRRARGGLDGQRHRLGHRALAAAAAPPAGRRPRRC